MFVVPGAAEPDAPGAVFEAPLTMPWDGGVVIDGDLTPDATGRLLPAGDLSGVAAWSTDGETTPPLSGRWTVFRWVAYAEISIWTYLDGEIDGAWASSDGGSDALPSIDILEAGNWFSAYELFASGTPEVRLTGAMIAPGAAFAPAEASAPSSPLAIHADPGDAAPSSPAAVMADASAASPSAPGAAFVPAGSGAPSAPPVIGTLVDAGFLDHPPVITYSRPAPAGALLDQDGTGLGDRDGSILVDAV